MVETELLTKKGTVRKRKPKKKVDYFTQDTQDAILAYRISKSQDERNQLYNSRIHHGLYKLAENIIHTFEFYHTDVENIEDLKYEVISFMLQKLHLYDPTKGKAYSYFGTIAKRYLITYCQRNYNKQVEKKALENVDNDKGTINILITNPEELVIDRSEIIAELVDFLEGQIFNIFEKEDELKAADALLEILKRAEKIDISNKKVLYAYIKEITDVKSATITNVIGKVKKIYQAILNRKIENDDY
jgi:hypothetical protein